MPRPLSRNFFERRLRCLDLALAYLNVCETVQGCNMQLRVSVRNLDRDLSDLLCLIYTPKCGQDMRLVDLSTDARTEIPRLLGLNCGALDVLQCSVSVAAQQTKHARIQPELRLHLRVRELSQ